MNRSPLPAALGCIALAGVAALAHTATSASAGDAAVPTPALAPAIATGVAPPAIPVPSMAALNRSELPGGIVVEDLKLGEGLEVKSGAIVVAHYHGTLKADPSVVFDSSYVRGEPIGLPLSMVIPGWQQGVPGMHVGGIRRLTIPATLAYGERSPSPEIPANSDLVFILEIVDLMQVEDLVVGSGEPVTGRWVALTTFTVRDSKGKIVEQHGASDPYLLVRSEWEATSLGLEGMMRGGKRRLTVPADLNHWNPAFGTHPSASGPVTVEVELLNLKLVPPDADAPGC